MAKLFKHFGFGPKKQPPVPPIPDYEMKDYLPNGTCDEIAVQTVEDNQLLVYQEYSEPLDLRSDFDEADYTLPTDETYYSQPCDLLPDCDTNVEKEDDDYYEEVSTCNCHDEDVRPADEYDEPWEWSVGRHFASSLQISSTQQLSTDESSLTAEEIRGEEEDDDMTTRQRHIYETAFDSRVKREVEDIDRLAQSPVLHSDYLRTRLGSRDGAGLRITSRPPSSTGSCSSSSTPTHQPRVLRESPRLAPRPFPPHLTPTEKRKVTLVRDPSSSPKAHHIRVTASVEPLPRTLLNNQNGSPFVTKKPIHGHQGIKVLPSEPCKNKNNSTSNETHRPERVMNGTNLKTTKDMDQLSVSSDSPNNVPRKVAALESTRFPCHATSCGDVQSPQNDNRPSDDYDPPWEYPKLTNGTATAVTSEPHHDTKTNSSGNTESASSSSPPLPINKPDVPPSLTKPSGPPARPNLNLNLNVANSPKRARQNLTLNFGCFALSVVGEKVDPSIPLEKQGWYHGSISRLDAENLLRVLKEGSYLVRNSESSKQDYSLSLKSARGFMHMKIVHNDGQFILGQFSKPFPSIPEMIHHYSINKLPIKGAEHMSLLYPVIDQLL